MSCFVGMDVAQAPWDMAVRPAGARWAVPHDADGVVTLVEWLPALPPTLLVLEAPGGLERIATRVGYVGDDTQGHAEASDVLASPGGPKRKNRPGPLDNQDSCSAALRLPAAAEGWRSAAYRRRSLCDWLQTK